MSGARDVNRPFLAEALAADLAAFSPPVLVTDAQRARLLDYLALIEKWNAVYNLTAIRDPGAMLTQHVVDSLSIVPAVQQWVLAHTPQARLLDVGSGAGLPGIVLAIALPALQVTCIDTVGKKAAFMRQAKGSLGLANLTVEEGRVEQLQGRYDALCSRAFATIADFIDCSAHALADDGVVLAMKGAHPQAELEALASRQPGRWEPKAVLPLQVPRLAAQRHLAVIARSS